MSKSFWLLSAGLAALATPAYAQDDPAAPTTGSGTEEAAVQNADEQADDNNIVVTAKAAARSSRTCRSPCTAVGGEQMQNSGATDIRQLNQLAPSLLVSSTGTEANGSARIRGIGTVGDNPGLESSVAVFIDGVYRSRSGIGLNELGEIERIEVLRGPQGTLFGRNASAGLIHVITRRPDFEFGGYAELTYGNYDYIRAAGAITGADRRDARRPARRRLCAPRRLLRRRQRRRRHRERRQRPRPLLRPRPAAVRAERRALDPADRRLYAAATNPAAAPSISACSRPSIRRPATPATSRSALGARRLARTATASSTCCPASAAPSRRVGDPFSRDISSRPGRTYRGRDRRLGRLAARSIGISAAPTLTSITAYRDYKAGQRRRHRLQQCRHPATATTTATPSATSRPSPRNSGSRARPSTACSTGWSAAISPTRTCTSATISGSAANMAPSPPAASSPRVNPIRRFATRRPRAASSPAGRATVRFAGAHSARPRPAGAERPRPPQHGQQCRRQRRQSIPEQPQLGDLHPQHLQHHRPARA